MGLVVVFNAPSYFFTFFKMIKRFVDEKTLEKVLITGPAPPDSPDDRTLQELLGADWRSLCNAETKYSPNQSVSPGFVPEEQWARIQKTETIFASLPPPPPPTSIPTSSSTPKPLPPKPKRFRPAKLVRRASASLKTALLPSSKSKSPAPPPRPDPTPPLPTTSTPPYAIPSAITSTRNLLLLLLLLALAISLRLGIGPIAALLWL